MLRGFDIPAFRKDIQRGIKHSKQVPSIEEFWSTWLHQMSNAVRTIEDSFREILEINGDEKAGILPMQVSSTEELVELEGSVMSSATCVKCGQTIPGASKLADFVLPSSEALARDWSGKLNPDGTITVKMCIQCQINEAEALKQR
jgi:hypothetical protein